MTVTPMDFNKRPPKAKPANDATPPDEFFEGPVEINPNGYDGEGVGSRTPAGLRDEVAAARKAPSFELWDEAKIWEPLPPPDFRVAGLFVRGSLGLIVAYGSSFKTWLAIALTLAVATGADWLGMECQKGESCFIDFESGDYELRRRAHLVAKGHGYETPIHGFTFVSMPGMSLAEDAFFQAMAPIVERFSVVVIDSLAAGSGGVDENDARFAAPLNRLKTIASRSGCIIVLIHHSRKTSGDGKADDREMTRGTSAIFNALDVQLTLARGDEGDVFVLRQSKARGGKKIDPRTVRVDDVATDAVTVTAGELREAPPGVRSTSQTIRAAKATVLQVVAVEHDLKSKSAVYRRTRGNKPAVFGAIDELQEDGVLVVHEGAFRLASEVR